MLQFGYLSAISALDGGGCMSSCQLSQESVKELETLLRTINTVVRHKGREVLADWSISPPQFDVLLLLNEYGGLTIGEVSNKMFLAFSTTTDLVDRMERNGLAERVRDLEDRRVVRLRMCHKGRQLIDQVLQARRGYLASVLADWQERDVLLLLESLRRIAAKMEG
jgi:DNA-binding MarR family transcriptional regulator